MYSMATYNSSSLFTKKVLRCVRLKLFDILKLQLLKIYVQYEEIISENKTITINIYYGIVT